MSTLILRLIKWILYPSIRNATKVIINAPICCKEQTEYVGESVGFTRTATYQCQKCKNIYQRGW